MHPGLTDIVIAALVGGFAVRMVEWFLFRDQDAAAVRTLQQNEINTLRLRLDAMAVKIETKSQENAQLEDENTELRMRCFRLENRVAELEKQLGLTSIQLPVDPHKGGP